MVEYLGTEILVHKVDNIFKVAVQSSDKAKVNLLIGINAIHSSVIESAFEKAIVNRKEAMIKLLRRKVGRGLYRKVFNVALVNEDEEMVKLLGDLEGEASLLPIVINDVLDFLHNPLIVHFPVKNTNNQVKSKAKSFSSVAVLISNNFESF